MTQPAKSAQRGLIGLHAAVTRAMLVDDPSALGAQINGLTQHRTSVDVAEMHSLRRLGRDLYAGPQRRRARPGLGISAAERGLGRHPDRGRVLGD